MKSLIYAFAILLLVYGCGGESSEPATDAKAQAAEPVAQTRQTRKAEPEDQVSQSRRRTSGVEKKETSSAYQNAIQASIKKSSKDKDSNDDNDG